MRIKRVLGALVLTLVVGSLTWAQEPIRIGFQGPITGPWAYEGELAVQCVQVAVKLINERGGVLGRPLELVIEDDGGTPRGGVLAAQRLVAMGVPASVASYGSSICEPASAIYEEGSVVMINYGCTAVGLSQHNYNYYFRTCGRDDAQGVYFAEVVVPMFGARRVALMHDNTTFAKGVAEETLRALQPMIEAGLVEVVYYDAIVPGERDYTPAITSVRDANPDIWYYTGYYPEFGLLLRQGKDLGFDWTECPIVGANPCVYTETIEIAGLDAAMGALMTQEPLLAYLPYPEAEEFRGAFQAEHGFIPDSPWAVYAADAVNTIAFAMEKAGTTDPTALADLLHSGEVIGNGITGPLRFSPEGDRVGIPYDLYVVDEEGNIVLFDPEVHGHLVGLGE